jgi:SanA protein
MLFVANFRHMKTRKERKHKKRWLLWLGMVLLGFILYSNIRIDRYSKGKLYDTVSDVPHYHTALVLGTSPIGRNGGPNLYFLSRIDATVKLYEAGKIDRILVSGDNRKEEYNEPEEMKKALVDQGIPEEVIFLDYAGFRTLDSVVRAKEVFGQSEFIVVSQKFHNERAVFIAQKIGIKAAGFNAKDVRASYGFITHVRELGARCKVFIDLLLGKKPHFLGEPVDIG